MRQDEQMQTDTPTDVIFIGGRSGVGKSSVAAEVSRILARADIRHALIEGDNLDQAYPQPWRDGINLAEQNLAAMWKNYRAVGYSRLIFTNTVSVLQVTELKAALGGETHSSAVLLTSTDTTAAHRLGNERSAPRWPSTSTAATSQRDDSTRRTKPSHASPPTAAPSRRSRTRSCQRGLAGHPERRGERLATRLVVAVLGLWGE
jgi:predicted ATPase